MTFKYLLRRLGELKFSLGTPSLSHGYPITPYGDVTATPFVSKDLEELVSYAEEYRAHEARRDSLQVREYRIREDIEAMNSDLDALAGYLRQAE